MENDLDHLEAEIAEQNILLDKGLTFYAGDKKYLISQPRLGQLDKMASELIKLDVEKAELESEDWIRRFSEQKRIIKPNVKTAARIVAIATVKHYRPNKYLHLWYGLKENYLVRQYTKRFLWELSPADLFKLIQVVLKASNLGDFTSSIALLSTNRTTAPQAIEDDQRD